MPRYLSQTQAARHFQITDRTLRNWMGTAPRAVHARAAARSRSMPFGRMPVLRRSQPDDARRWREVDASPAGLGSAGPDMLHGHMCPACTAAVEWAGAVGPTARGQAVVTHVQHTRGLEPAMRLRDLLEEDAAVPTTGWGAMVYTTRRNGLPEPEPNDEPWAHLATMLDRL